MTYRERRARRADRLRGWAEKREQKAAASLTAADRALDGIPPGQPILVGHHSERRHRAALDRFDRKMTAGLEHSAKAREMAGRAAEIDRQADRAIYRDDTDALEQLDARIAALEADRARKKQINAEIRRGAGWAERLNPPLTAAEQRDLEMAARFNNTIGYPAYAFTNLSSNIRRQAQRRAALAETAAQRARVAAVLEQERHRDAPASPDDLAFAIHAALTPAARAGALARLAAHLEAGGPEPTWTRYPVAHALILERQAGA